MNYLIIQLLSVLMAIMQNPSVPPEIKIQVYNETLPVIEKYMDEIKMEDGTLPAAGEVSTPAPAPVEPQPETGIQKGNPEPQVTSA